MTSKYFTFYDVHMTDKDLNTTSEDITLQQKNTDKNKIIKETVSSVTETLEKPNLTIDQKIDQLTAQVQNLASGVSGLMDIMKIMLGKQIEYSNEIEDVVVKTKDIASKTDKSLVSIADVKKTITDNQVNILNEHQNTMKKLQRMVENQRSIAQ
jgi:prophage DNA circulation protein